MTEAREWRVTGMDCGACVAKVRGAVERLPGVSGVEVTLMAERLQMVLDPAQTTPEAVEKTVRAIGYGIAPKGAVPEKKGFVLPEGAFSKAAPDGTLSAQREGAGHDHDNGHYDACADDHGVEEGDTPFHRSAKGRLLIVTGLLLAAAWIVRLAVPGGPAHWAFIVATLIGLAPVARRAWTMARVGMPFTIEMLMTIAAGGALIIGAAEEAALVVFLFAAGETLEGVAAGRARQGIRALAGLVPKSAMVERAGGLREVPAESLVIGDVVLVRPGECVPADGEVIDGISGIDESPVNGESVPRTREPGDDVFAGSINTEAALRIRVAKAAEDNTIARIVRLVEEAETSRAPTERFIDRFSRVYMPIVVGIAALVAVAPPLLTDADWSVWVYRALALLLIGCPCALVISVPAAIASALSAGARQGLLMKGGAVIEAVARTRQVALDKTGTLTRGRPAVTDVVAADAGDLLRLAAAVESGSSHPLARAILERAEADGLSLPVARDARAIPGRGVSAVVEGATVTVGSPRHAEEAGALDEDARSAVARLEQEGKTVVVVWSAKRPAGLIALRDEPREDAAKAMAALRELGVTPIMLTGDNARTAAAIAAGLGIECRAGLMPEDKVAAMREMAADGHVMMVGDGINDAPALAAAQVGVAMGSGTDVALETADAAILRDRVMDIPDQIRLARAAMANIRQNLAIALGLKAAFLVTTIVGITGLWPAIMADTGATVLVTANALRMLRWGKPRAAD